MPCTNDGVSVPYRIVRLPGNCFHCLPSRWNDFQDEHDEVLEQLESFRATFALSNTDERTRNSTPTKLPEQQEQQQRGTGGVEGGVLQGGGVASEDISKVARPISGREGRGSRSSNAPPRPASGRSIIARTSSSCSYEDGSAGSSDNRGRNNSWGSTGKSPREDGLTKPASNPSSRRSSPRRPPSSGSSVPSPRYCSSPRTSGPAATTANSEDANRLRKGRNTDEYAEGERGWERNRGGCDEEGNKEGKENQGRVRDFSHEHAVGATEATATDVAAAYRSGLLHAGDSGGYEDDFDDCFEDDSEEGEQHNKEQDVLSARRSSGGAGGDKANDARHTPLVEVVYRPPSGGSRGKGDRPKSAARQGRSASLNGAG